MIAINWFELHLFPALSVPAECLKKEDVSEKPSVSYRVLLRTNHDNGTKIRYHLTSSPPVSAPIRQVLLDSDPSLVEILAETGFKFCLEERGFSVRQQHVGYVGLRPVNNSAYPEIYTSLVGLNFRCRHGFGTPPFRWGMILSFATSQRFALTLSDHQLAKYARGRRVVSVVPGKSSRDHNYVLKECVDGEAVVVDKEGVEHILDASEWTLLCSRDYLLGYMRNVIGDKGSSELTIRLQQDALSLTPERRINTHLAKQQLERVQELLRVNNLLSFYFPLPDEPLVRMSLRPLEVGGD